MDLEFSLPQSTRSTSKTRTAVRVVRLHPNAELPQQMTPGSAGCDVRACLDAPVTLQRGERASIPTGLAMEIPEGYEVQVRPRSGLAWKSGVTVVNTPGTIDSDYRGEVKILLINLGAEAVTISSGDRVAQVVVQTVPLVEWSWAERISETSRSSGGFGSTGAS